MDETVRAALRAIAASHRALADSLERLLQDQPPTEAGQVDSGTRPEAATPASSVWDPETDEPLVQPKVVGTREEQDWCCFTYLGGIYAINKRYERGATVSEVREYAIKAGYRDGRAVTAWSKGRGPTYNDEAKQRWIKPEGAEQWVKGLATKLGVTLPDDLAEPWTTRAVDDISTLSQS